MSSKLIAKPFTILTAVELEQALNTINLKEETLFKLQSNDTIGYDLTFEIDAYLKQIDIQNIHEINLIKKFVNKNINDQLKLTVKLNQNQQIIIQLDNDANIRLNEVIEYINKIEFVKSDEFFLSPINSNEILLPSVKIVKLILEQPNKYSVLQLYDKSTMNIDNHNNHSLRCYNNTNLERDIYSISYSKFSTSNTARNSTTLLHDKFNVSEIDDDNNNANGNNYKNSNNYQKKYKSYTKNEKEESNSNNDKSHLSNNIQANCYQSSHILNKKNKSHLNLTNQNLPKMNPVNSDNENISLFPSTSLDVIKNNNISNLKTKSYTTYNTIKEKYRKYGTNMDDKENNDNNTKDENNQFIKKDYGIYQPLTSNDKNDSFNENIQNSKHENEQDGEMESLHSNNHMNIDINNIGINRNVHHKDPRKYASEKRNYRQYEGSRTPDHNNNIDLYKKYDKYSSNNEADNSKQYALSPNYNQHHRGENIVTSSNITTHNTNTTNTNATSNKTTNNNISAYELRNKVNSMRNQLNAYASLNPINNIKNSECHKKDGSVTNNNCLNYKVFSQENSDAHDNSSYSNFNNINNGPVSNKDSHGYPNRNIKYES